MEDREQNVTHVTSGKKSAVGTFVGVSLNGLAGAVTPFKAVGNAISNQGAQKNMQIWNLTENLKAAR